MQGQSKPNPKLFTTERAYALEYHLPLFSDTSLKMLAEADINLYATRVTPPYVVFDLEYRFNNPRDGYRPCWRKMSIPFYLDPDLDGRTHVDKDDDGTIDNEVVLNWDIYLSQIYNLVYRAKIELQKGE